jgi:hypothetical protein
MKKEAYRSRWERFSRLSGRGFAAVLAFWALATALYVVFAGHQLFEALGLIALPVLIFSPAVYAVAALRYLPPLACGSCRAQLHRLSAPYIAAMKSETCSLCGQPVFAKEETEQQNPELSPAAAASVEA